MRGGVTGADTEPADAPAAAGLRPGVFAFGANGPDLPPRSLRGPPRDSPVGRILRDPARLRRAAAAAALLEWERGAAFLFTPILVGTGSVIYFSLGAEPRWTSLAASTAALALAAWLARDRFRLQLAILALFCVVAGMLTGKIETWRFGTKVMGSEIATRLTGRVVSRDEMANGRVRLTLDVVSTARPELRYAPDRVRVTARRVPEGVRPGSTISGAVRLQPPSGPVRPGGYDFSFQSYFDGIGGVGFFLSGPVLETVPAPTDLSARLGRAVETARESLAARIESQIAGQDGEIAAALLAGVRGGIPDEVNEALRKSGLAHILSISGLHMALVAGVVMGLLRMSFALFPGVASRYPVKKVAASGALLATAAYLALSGSDVAAQRSFVMLAVILLAMLFDRAALTMRNLALSTLLVVAVTPHEVMGPSFQMSFAATAALVGGFAAWSSWRERKNRAPPPKRHWLIAAPRTALLYLGGLVATSFVAGAATTLYGAYHFQRMSPLGTFANLVAGPVISLVMVAGVMALALMPFGLDGPPLWVMGKLIAIVVAIAEWFAARSPLDAIGLIPPPALLVLTAAMLIFLVMTTWLRLAALPVLLVGLALLGSGRAPDAFVSEDGRLLAVVTGDGDLAVNRTRPSDFEMENWGRALAIETVVEPGGVADGFACDDELCVAQAESGALAAYAVTADAARGACGSAALIVVNDPTARDICPAAAVVTRRDLARHGSAAVWFDGDAANVRYSITEPFRPWHANRAFSREARGRPSYVAKPRPPKTNVPRAADAPR